MDKYVHTHLHTEYSFLDGLSKVWDTPAKEAGNLIIKLKEIGQPACAITDHGSTAGWIRFDKACHKNDIIPLFGVEGYYCNDRKIKGLSDDEKIKVYRGKSNAKEKREALKEFEYIQGRNRRSHFVAIAMNEKGMQEIQKTLSIASVEGFYYRPRWDWELIKEMKNCIFSTACAGGIANYWIVNYLERNEKLPDKSYNLFINELSKWKDLLGDRLYLEMMAIDYPLQAKIDKYILNANKELNIPLLITNDSHYVNKEDWEVHDILLALQSSHKQTNKDVLNDPNRMRYDMHDLYVKNRDQMFKSFMKHHNKFVSDKIANNALDNSLELMERCKGNKYTKGMIMPDIEIPEINVNKKYQLKNKLDQYLYYLARKGFRTKILKNVDKKLIPVYKERFKEELKQIMKQGFTPYFILCHDLMKWVDSNGIARGPARGSSAGSLIAYLLDIVMIDPIPHKLLFSRFIDPNRTDYPDVDMDFEDVRRHEIVEYFMNKFGQEKVAMLGNNMVFKSKLALKDVARLYNVPIFETQEVCNLVIERSGADSRLSFCLEDTFNQFDFAKHYKKKYPKVANFAQQLEGLTKQQGIHAAGLVIGDKDLSHYTATRKFEKKEQFRVTYMDKHDAEDIGLLKMDILGLNTMAILSQTLKIIKERHGRKISLQKICDHVTYKGGSKKVYSEFAKAHTIGVFQFGSPGLTRLAKQVHIDRFSEISDCVSLHRPGPIHSGAMNQYPAFKKDPTKRIKPLHPIIEENTKDTYGLIIYQEQVMQIVRELGDFTWAQTNTVRKVMSKSGGAEYFMKTFWPTWKASCIKKGLTEDKALKAFHMIMSFGSWSFNLSHGVSYAMVSYLTMWFKVYFPIEYVTAYLNYVNDTKGDKIKHMIKDANRMGIEIKEPSINYSKHKFVIKDNHIISGLLNIKNIGVKAVDTIIENQPYSDIIDFIKKIDNRACNKRAIENLIKAGAFDEFNYNKKKLIEHIDEINKLVKKGNDKSIDEVKKIIDCCKGNEEYTNQEVTQMKQDVSPVVVGKHISEYYQDVINKFDKHISITKLKDIVLDETLQSKDRKDTKRLDVWVCGLLTDVDLKRLSQEVKEVIDQTKEQRYALANLEDETDFIVLSFKNEVYERYEQDLYSWKNKVLLVRGTVNYGWKKLFVDKVFVMDDMRSYVNSIKKDNFYINYLFQHPITAFFKKYGGIKKVRKKYGCKPLIDVKKLRAGSTMWSIGFIVDVQTFTIKRGDNAGKKFHWIFFEDESYCASFMIFPTDPRFNKMKKQLFDLYDNNMPFMLRVQRDLKFNSKDVAFKQVSISIDKRIEWDKMIKTFKLKDK